MPYKRGGLRAQLNQSSFKFVRYRATSSKQAGCCQSTLMGTGPDERSGPAPVVLLFGYAGAARLLREVAVQLHV